MAPALHIDRMDPALYEAVVEVNAEEYEALLQKVEQLGVTPKGNTILHIAALYGHTHFVQKILEQHSHAASLLCARNKKNETALHIAAMEGHTDVVSALISYAKTCPELESGIGATDILRMMDDDKDTAFNKAVRKGHLEVVKLLVTEDPKFELLANEAGETPLYLAAELLFHKCLLEILNNCERPVYGGPLGRTALHAAIINSATYPYGPSDCTKLLLEKEASLCEVGDDWGWTPLHYAVKLYNKEAVCDILQVKSSAAYIRAGKEGEWTTAIHIAVSEDSVVLFEQILQCCPLCWEMVNSKGQNVLHEAILSNGTEIIKFILDSPKRDHLIDEKDEDGNTPLHLLAASDTYVPELNQHPRLNGGLVFNKQHLTPLDIAYHQKSTSVVLNYDPTTFGKLGWRSDPTKKTKRNACNNDDKTRKQMEEESVTAAEIAKTHIVVATLIGTVTFAAGMTLPEVKINEGSKLSLQLALYSVAMLVLSLIGVVLAFITGLFAVLTVHSSAVAVGVCVCVCVSALVLIGFPFFTSLII